MSSSIRLNTNTNAISLVDTLLADPLRTGTSKVPKDTFDDVLRRASDAAGSSRRQDDEPGKPRASRTSEKHETTRGESTTKTDRTDRSPEDNKPKDDAASRPAEETGSDSTPSDTTATDNSALSGEVSETDTSPDAPVVDAVATDETAEEVEQTVVPLLPNPLAAVITTANIDAPGKEAAGNDIDGESGVAVTQARATTDPGQRPFDATTAGGAPTPGATVDETAQTSAETTTESTDTTLAATQVDGEAASTDAAESTRNNADQAVSLKTQSREHARENASGEDANRSDLSQTESALPVDPAAAKSTRSVEPSSITRITTDTTVAAVSTAGGSDLSTGSSGADSQGSGENGFARGEGGTTATAARSSKAAPNTATAEGSDAPDRARFVQRVARAFQTMTRRGEDTLRLRLSPPELGSLRIEISVKNGQMTARIETENQSARSLLLDNLPALRDRLAEQDIKIQRFDVELMEQQAEDYQPGHTPEDGQQGGSAGRNGSGTYAAGPVEENEPAPRDPGRLNWDGNAGLDVIV